MFIIYAMHRMTTIPPTKSDQRTNNKDDNAPDSVKKSEKKVSLAGSSTQSKARLLGYDEIMDNGSKVGKGGKNGKMSAKSEDPHYVNPKWSSLNGSRSDIVYVNRPQANETEKKKKLKKKHAPPQRKEVYQQDGKTEIIRTPGIVRAYVAQAFLRTGIEAVFLYLQYDLFKFDVPELYVCDGFPCPRTVECFVSRPMEKTLFLRCMYGMTILSLLLNIIEIYQIISKWVRRTCFRSKDSAISPDDRLPMEQIVIQSGRDGAVFRRALLQNTFPDLGPFPRSHNNSFGDSSGDDSMDSNYRFYVQP
uniref:Gap junction protein n=1 Tax=Ciona savignyi TaxID=51511 RepID=H2YUN8_CIOSA